MLAVTVTLALEGSLRHRHSVRVHVHSDLRAIPSDSPSALMLLCPGGQGLKTDVTRQQPVLSVYKIISKNGFSTPVYSTKK